MRTRRTMTMLAAMLGMPLAALAGVAETSATAGSNGRGSGTAAATANYDGDGIALTRTDAHSGRLNVARGLSVGLDADGLSISNSYALAGRFGPAVGGTFNLHIGTDGKTSFSGGRVNASGDAERSVAVGGAIGESRGRSVTVAQASGATGGRGRVQAETRAEESRSVRAERGRGFVRAAGAIRAVVAGRR
ncbi:MAG TPA: hypothetical protein P5572_20795 [Phycisphaerae bacterium]|nr:hypothetical protein [Phycisphaerales bacterium]HRX87471.1 hypothetical protein [Phycisphaerae bacterium]